MLCNTSTGVTHPSIISSHSISFLQRHCFGVGSDFTAGEGRAERETSAAVSLQKLAACVLFPAARAGFLLAHPAPSDKLLMSEQCRSSLPVLYPRHLSDKDDCCSPLLCHSSNEQSAFSSQCFHHLPDVSPWLFWPCWEIRSAVLYYLGQLSWFLMRFGIAGFPLITGFSKMLPSPLDSCICWLLAGS